MPQKFEKLVPDTSIIIEGLISEQLKKKQLIVAEVIIHEAVLAELEHQANQGRAIGYLGLDELDRIKRLAKEKKFSVKYSGRRPRAAEIRYASLGEIDSLIRELAWEEDATLFTIDKIQARIAEARDIKFYFLEPKKIIKKKLRLEGFFDQSTMSVHLRENVVPQAKRGMPGKWDFVNLSKTPLKRQEIQAISREIIENAKVSREGFIEMQREASTIVQLGLFRIVITKPPFSDGWEITAVKPIKKLSLEDYKPSPKLSERLAAKAEGVLIAGSPGEGKTTFASALAEHYASKQKIVKTIEAPRDLVLPEHVTQYAISHAVPEELHDILLLSRPDYTVFDEMRNTADFKLFADLRLSGIGLVGVLHATSPVDAIQRFVGRIELGVIPQIIDTVIFIKHGRIEKVLGLQMTVKVPSGMTEEDLARPVVEVRDFETNKVEFEIYSYGEETMVIPVKRTEQTPLRRLAAKQIERVIRKISDTVKVDVLSDHKAVLFVPQQDIPRVIGKQGQVIQELERELGMSLEVQELTKPPTTTSVPYEVVENSKYVMLFISDAGQAVDIYAQNQFLCTARASKKGEIKIKKKSNLGRTLAQALHAKREIELKKALP